ncbi:MAG: SpoIIE family protein phosphatase [Clostridia bacterium]|nr:SpoIIE family protein phosphatase [Clostridia bacterium]
MISLRKNYDYTSICIYLTLYILFAVFSVILKTPSVYSLSAYGAALSLNVSPFLLPVILVCSYLTLGSFGLLPSIATGAVFLSAVALIHRLTKTKLKYSLFFYVAISLTVYLIIGDANNFSDFTDRLISAAITVTLTPVCTIAFSAVCNKRLKFKFSYEEYVCLAAVCVATGMGISNLISPEVFKGLSVVIILLSAYFFRTGITTLISAVLGISLSVFFARIEYVAIFTVWGIAAEVPIKLSRYLSAVAVVLCDYCIYTLFGIYFEYGAIQIAAVSAGAIIFCAIPTKLLSKIKSSLFTFREKQLSREAINRNRAVTANRLYELSGVFTEISAAFGFLKKEGLSEQKIKNSMEEKLIKSACAECKFSNECKNKGFPLKKDVDKLIDIGIAKSKVSFIDVPSEFANGCKRISDVLYILNKMLAEYSLKKTDELNYENGRELLAKEAEGISEILKGLALDTGTVLQYRTNFEKSLADEMFKKGLNVTETLIYGEDDNLSVSIIAVGENFSTNDAIECIKKILKADMFLYEKADLAPEKYYLSFKMRPEFDAVFGVANCVKEGKILSGDTHAVTKINGDKFLIALSDGMGSGKTAQTVSSVSLSLIESFYKAGLNSKLILSTVNKLLAINSDDTFTALDVAVVDLKNSCADFIKYGSPYGFILNRSGIKIVEGNTLPLGILEDLSPSVCSANLVDGDIILMLSDGISDSFKSSSELVDYLRTIPAFNPQSLADNVLNKAIENYGGEKKDDMTALAVRIYRHNKIA